MLNVSDRFLAECLILAASKTEGHSFWPAISLTVFAALSISWTVCWMNARNLMMVFFETGNGLCCKQKFSSDNVKCITTDTVQLLYSNGKRFVSSNKHLVCLLLFIICWILVFLFAITFCVNFGVNFTKNFGWSMHSHKINFKQKLLNCWLNFRSTDKALAKRPRLMTGFKLIVLCLEASQSCLPLDQHNCQHWHSRPLSLVWN